MSFGKAASLGWVCLVLFGCQFGTDGESPPPAENMGRHIVVLRSGTGDPDFTAGDILSEYAGHKLRVFRRTIKGFSAELPQSAVPALRQDSRVRYVVEDRPVKGLNQVLPDGVDRVEADRNATAAIGSDGGDVDVDIAVIDTGVAAHPDLNLFESVNLASSEPGSPGDGNGHGTHVAGTAAARDDDSGVVGVAPGARLWSVKVLDSQGHGFLSDVIAGVEYVTMHAAEIEVANMSLGGLGADDGDCGRTNQDPLHEAICASVEAGVVYVVSAGNDSADAAGTIPAAYDEVITVSAIRDTDGQPGGDSFASFSNFGADVDLAAPGVDILSTWRTGGTHVLSGTSMASPHVAGSAALYVVKHGKPADAAGVRAVRDGLVALGASGAFTGDPDSHPEPLVDAGAIDPEGSDPDPDPDPEPDPEVRVTAALDKEIYNPSLGESTALVTVTVKDEAGDPLAGLAPTAFQVFVDDAGIEVTFMETGISGEYRAVVDLSSVSAGTHALAVFVTDSRGATGAASDTFQVVGEMPSASVFHVHAVSYFRSGGFFGDSDLNVSVEVRDELNRPVADVSVTTELFMGFYFYGRATRVTGADGRVTFKAPGAPRYQCYWARVLRLTRPGWAWNALADGPNPGLCY